jgi:PAS domain S-box-containing protein
MEVFRYIPLCKTFEDASKAIFEYCKKLTGARSGYVALLSENGKENEVLFLDAGGIPCKVDPNLPMPIRGLREIAYKKKEVAYENSLPESLWMEYMPEGHVRLDNVLFAPLNIEKKTVGVIGIANKPGGFNEQDVHISKSLGDLAALALTYAKSQCKLKNSEDLFRTIFEQSAVGIAQVTPDGSFKRTNSKFSDIIGYSVHELTTMSFDEITYPEDLNKESTIIELVRKGEIDSFEIEKRYIHKNGHLVWAKLFSNVVRDETNTIQYAVASVIDITKRKIAETALQQSEEKYRKLYDDAPVGYFEYDLQGNITRVNLTELKMLGYTAEEMIGQPCWKFIVDEVAREQILAKLRGVRPPAVGLERTYRRKDGTTFPVLFEDRLLFDDDGHIRGIRTAIQDITDRKLAEEALQKERTSLKTILDSIPVMIDRYDDNGNMLYLNKKGC